MKYSLFIGRWSPFHNGHKAIIDSFVNNGKAVCIAVRDSVDEYPLDLRISMIKAVYMDEIRRGFVKIITIPDIELVVVGRNVGYGLVEMPDIVKAISGTKIRFTGSKENLPPEVKELIELWEENG